MRSLPRLKMLSLVTLHVLIDGLPRVARFKAQQTSCRMISLILCATALGRSINAVCPPGNSMGVRCRTPASATVHR